MQTVTSVPVILKENLQFCSASGILKKNYWLIQYGCDEVIEKILMCLCGNEQFFYLSDFLL